MNLTPVILVLIAPVFAFLLFRVCNKYCDRKSFHLMISSFLIGIVAFICSTLVLNLALSIDLASTRSFNRTLFTSFIVLAGAEELFKWLALRFFIVRNPAFDKPIKGIFFSVMIAIGFVTSYNLFYVIGNGAEHFTPIKGYSLIVAHITLSSIMGFFVAFGKFRRSKYIESFIGLVVAVFLHGLYEFILFSKDYDLMIIVSVGTIIITALLFRKAYKTKKEDLNHIDYNKLKEQHESEIQI